MIVIGGICAFQIGSLCRLGNQDMADYILHVTRGLDLRGVAPPH